MGKKVNHGNDYNTYRKECESKLHQGTCIGSNLDKTVEGFKNYSRTQQKKNPSEFDVSNEMDPGQMVMCQASKARYIKLIGTFGSSKQNLVSFQQIEVYDENNKNVALSKNNYINDYQSSDGHCSTSVIAGPMGPIELPGKDRGSITTEECENMCNQDNTCSGFQIENEASSEGLNKCRTYTYSSIKGDGTKGYSCRVRQRRQGDSTVSATTVLYPKGDLYAPINGNINTNVSWEGNNYVSFPNFNKDNEWTLDLKKDINVKKVKVYFNKEIFSLVPEQNALTLQVLDKDHNILTTKKLTSDIKQSFDINITNANCGGPVIEKNTKEFEELEQLQTIYNRQLQEYNQSIKNLMENSSMYVHATNNSSNKAINSWVKDPKTGKIGYVTTKGVYKELPDSEMGNQIQGNNNCPNNYSQAQSVTIKAGEINSLDSAPYNEMVETSVGPLIKGDPMIANQTCSNAGENIYITEPAKTSNILYKGCNRSSGSHQADLGNTTLEGCRQRAEDSGINVFKWGLMVQVA